MGSSPHPTDGRIGSARSALELLGLPTGSATLEIPVDRRVWILSDMHIGDGASTEPFARKDDLLRRFLERAAREADVLVIAGDGFDLAQAFSFDRIARAHGSLIGDLRAIGRALPVLYLMGNHDSRHDGHPERDRAALEAFLPLRAADLLRVGPSILVAHGHGLDPKNQPGNRAAFLGARVHTLLERVIRTPVRIPMRHHYLWSTRLGHFLFYQYGQWRRARSALRRALGDEAGAAHDLAFLDYWGRGEWGDIHSLLGPVGRLLDAGAASTLVLGHSHQAGRVRFGQGTYVNTGSWSYDDATYAVLDHGRAEVRDFRTGRSIEDEAYRGVLGPHREKSFFDWWAAFYQGRLRYDVAAMHRAAAGERTPRRPG